MKFLESEKIELKSIVGEDIKKEIIAFANCDGGTVYVGVADDGTVLGVENDDDCVLQISNMVRDAVKPDVTMFIHYETLDCDGKAVVAVHIQRGTKRPYFLANKGLQPEGVYVRQGDATGPTTKTAIAQMIKNTAGDSFEDRRSLNQSLTFDALEKEFAARNMAFGKPQMQNLHLIDDDGLYTNVGLLLSDQCPYTMRAAVFDGMNQNVFKSREEFCGSLIDQLKIACAYINFHNKGYKERAVLRYIDTLRDYPETALREALLNALVHRDYSFHADTLINLYDDRMEIVSVGGLLPGLAPEDLNMGVSLCRNPHLYNVFYRLQLIEAYGTGMKKMMNAYADEPVKPQIKTTPNAFKTILPNVNFMSKAVEAPMIVGEMAAPFLTSDEGKIMQLLEDKQRITRKDAQELLGVSQSTAGRILKTLVDNGQITQRGGGRTTRYELIKS